MTEPNENPTPPTVDLRGYPDVDRLVKGYDASSAEAKRLAEENQRLQQQLQGFAANPRPDIPVRESPMDRLRGIGVPPEDVMEVARQVVTEVLKPLAEMAGSRQSLMAEYPDYGKYEADVMAWVKSDPRRSQWYDQNIVKEPAATSELAFLKYGEHLRRNAPAATPPPNEDMVHARVPGGGAGTAPGAETGYDAQVQQARERFEKTGSREDAERLAHLRLKQVIPDSHFQ
jgi:hypothetical protein